jgi:hypothetical protein
VEFRTTYEINAKFKRFYEILRVSVNVSSPCSYRQARGTIPPVSAQFVRNSIKHQIENATYTDNSVGFGNQPWLKRCITLAIKALRAAAWVSGAVLLTLWPCPAPRVQPAPFI